MGSRGRGKGLLVGVAVVLAGLVGAGNTWAATYHLRAASGTVTMPDGEVVTIWGFADCGTDPTCASLPPVSLPGPQLEVPPGASLSITLKNELPDPDGLGPLTADPVSLIVAGQSIDPVLTSSVTGQSYTTEVAPGSTGTYTFTAPRPGTYLYESGTHQAKQVQMGLYGALIVRSLDYSASNPIDYDSYTSPAGVTVTTSFDREAVLLLSEIDPAWHQAVALGLPYNAAYFQPTYWLINGKAYPDTADVVARAGGRVLLRYLNAGSQDHVIIIQGLAQQAVADDGTPVTSPQQTSAVVMNPGQTQDLIVAPAAAGAYPLFDRRLDITNRDQFPGGMITMVRVIDGSVTDVAILSSAPDVVTEGKTYLYHLVAVDPANLGAPLTYTVTPGLTVTGMTIDPATGRITWPTSTTDASATVGTHNVSVAVSNGVSTATQTLTIYVNSHPVISSTPPSTPVPAASLFSYSVAASDAD